MFETNKKVLQTLDELLINMQLCLLKLMEINHADSSKRRKSDGDERSLTSLKSMSRKSGGQRVYFFMCKKPFLPEMNF